MNVKNFENIIKNIVDEFDVEIVDDEIIYNSNFTSSFFYINEFVKNELLNDIDDDVKKNNNKIDELINEFVNKLHDELDDELNFNCYVVNDEIEIELIDDEFDVDDVLKLYDDMKIFL